MRDEMNALFKCAGLIAVWAFAVLFASPNDTHAQQDAKVRIVASLAFGATRPDDAIYQHLRQGLRELGWTEDRDYRFVHRAADGHAERLPALAEELARMHADVIVTGNDESTRAAAKAAGTIPIVALLYNHDPVASGFIRSFNQPGGNITGITVRDSQLAGKRLQLLKEIQPGLTRLAVLSDAPAQDELAALKEAARDLGVHLEVIPFTTANALSANLRTAKARKADAVMILHAPQFYVNRARIGTLVLDNQLPACTSFPEIVEAGALMSYSTDVRDQYQRGAYFIDRLFKGAKPADLPFEEATDIRLVINLKTAAALHLTVPQALMLRADRLIR